MECVPQIEPASVDYKKKKNKHFDKYYPVNCDASVFWNGKPFVISEFVGIWRSFKFAVDFFVSLSERQKKTERLD